MTREANTPLVLWLFAAVGIHQLFGEGGGAIARYHEDRSMLSVMAARARAGVTPGPTEVEFAIEETEKSPVDPPEPADETQTNKDDKTEPPKEPAKVAVLEEKKRPEPPQVAPEAPRKPPQKEEKPTVLVLEKEKKEEKPLLLEDPLKDRRIAVKQDKSTEDENKDAKFIADKSNKTDKEEAATQTAVDQNDPNPTPGKNAPGKDPNPGDSARTKIAQHDDSPGEKDKGPGEQGKNPDVEKPPVTKEVPRASAPAPQPAAAQPASPNPPNAAGDNRAAQSGSKGVTNPGGATEKGGASPKPPAGDIPPVVAGAHGSFNFAPGAGSSPPSTLGVGPTAPAPGASAAAAANAGTPGPKGIPFPGRGMFGPDGARAVLGDETLKKLRESDGERRKSEHRGSHQADRLERNRSAAENYVAFVKPGNQTSLNTAAVPFASYLNSMHNRIHPIFADSFLHSLSSLPQDHELNRKGLLTRLEIVLTKEGRVSRMGIVKHSGVRGFDLAAIDSVSRAAPFGPAPEAIVSSDGRVYLHWEFHREEALACSTQGARPYKLNVPAPKPDDEPPPKGAPPPREKGYPPPTYTPDSRHGALSRPKTHEG